MLIQIPKILNEKTLEEINKILLDADWEPSLDTQNKSHRLKANDDLSKYLSQNILQIIQKNPLFLGASLPNKVFSPVFIKHNEGQAYDVRVEDAIKQDQRNGFRIRNDLSAIIFLSNPDQYLGGELVIEENIGCQSIKLPAGDMILFPANCMNYLKQITKGQRLTINLAIESMIRDNNQRSILFDLDNSIRSIYKDQPEHQSIGQLSIIYNNLLRMWMDS